MEGKPNLSKGKERKVLTFPASLSVIKMKTSSKKRITNPFTEKKSLALFLHWSV